jgi:2-polyprenyl-3-methyl-5-hydroxy-6-metoxy-1,4-benzoquinol methylase
MPVDVYRRDAQVFYQRQQYAKGGIGAWYWNFRDRAVLSYIGPQDRCLLDLGCGEGLTLERLVKAFPGREVLGIDLDPENIAICREHGLPAKVGNLYHLDLNDGVYDVVLFLEVIEHLDQPELALQEIHRVLRPGGKVIVLFPNDLTFLLARLLTLKFQEARYDPGHLRQWNPAQMRQALEANGFLFVAQKMLPFYFWRLCLHGLVMGQKR